MFKRMTSNLEPGAWPAWAQRHGWTPAQASIEMLEMTQGGQIGEKTEIVAAFAGPLPTAGVSASVIFFKNQKKYGTGGGDSGSSASWRPYTTIRAWLPEGERWHNGLSYGGADNDGFYMAGELK